MKFSTTLLFILLLSAICLQQANGQSENCSTEPSLNEDDTFGFNVAPTPMEDNFAMTGTGCVDFLETFYPSVCANNTSPDNIVCFTPSNSCDILIQTATGGHGSSVNVFTGTCGEPASCVASAASPSPYNSVLIYPLSLTAGTQYCVVWERCSSASSGLTISQINGTDCGPLDVEEILVTPSVGENGLIDPSTDQMVTYNQTMSFEVTPDTGYAASVGGTCGGNLDGIIYTTNAITADCTVVASFALAQYTVTPSAGDNGSIGPSTNQMVTYNQTMSFEVTPDTGYAASVGGTCDGSLDGNIYTTNAITANCTVIATFKKPGEESDGICFPIKTEKPVMVFCL